jgi:hypothetical protein
MKRVMFAAVIAAMMILFLADPGKAYAEVNVTVGVNLPPVVIPGPPEVVFIPGTYVYYIPDINVDIFFYHGWWYRPYEGRWYRARVYNGPWGFVAPGRVPHVMLTVPPDFRRVPPGHERIPYGQLKKSWRTWERERYWDKRAEKEHYKEDKREHKERHKEERKKHGGHGGHGDNGGGHS